MTLQPGRKLLHHCLVEPIGEGGVGAVWKAVDTTLNREVAIKRLPEDLGYFLARTGRGDRARELLAELDFRSPTEFVPPGIPGWIYRCLGDREKDRELTARAVEEGASPHGLMLLGCPFPDLLAKLGIPERDANPIR